mgnify:CR=1 FL=1
MKTSLDFDILSDLYWLRVIDYSYWGIIEDKPSIIEITIPGYSSVITRYFDKYKSNGFNSVNLELNCQGDCFGVDKVPLPDGVYTLKLIGSPSKFNKERYYLKTDHIQNDIDRIVVDSFNKGTYSEIDADLTDIEIILRGAEAHLRQGIIKEAGQLYDLARKKIDKLRKCS